MMQKGLTFGNLKFNFDGKKKTFNIIPTSTRSTSVWTIVLISFILSPFFVPTLFAILFISLSIFLTIKVVKYNKKNSPIISAQTLLSQKTCEGIGCSSCYNSYFSSVFKSCPYTTTNNKKPLLENGGADIASLNKVENFLIHKNKLTKIT